MNLDGVDPVAFAAALSQLAPTHPLVCAARAAADVAEGRVARAAAMAAASAEASEGMPAGAADTYRDSVVAWRGRAEVDGEGSRAAEIAAALVAPPVPEPRDPAGSELEGVTAGLVAEARAWAAAQDDAAAERAHDAMHAHWAAERGHDDDAARWRVR